MDHPLELTKQAEDKHFWFRGFRAFVAPVIKGIAGGRTDARLIDCGCGTGNNLALLSPYGEAWGFDLSRTGVNHASRSGRRVVQADTTRIPFASNSFDVATSFDVLQCVAADHEAVREMARIVETWRGAGADRRGIRRPARRPCDHLA